MNRNELLHLYRAHLLLNDLEHGEMTFNTFIADYTICPGGGMITFEDEKIYCSVHNEKSKSSETDPGDEVPFLYEMSWVKL